jgi:hypothetical protein
MLFVMWSIVVSAKQTAVPAKSIAYDAQALVASCKGIEQAVYSGRFNMGNYKFLPINIALCSIAVPSSGVTFGHHPAALVMSVSSWAHTACCKPGRKAIGAELVVAVVEEARRDLDLVVVEKNAPRLVTADPSSKGAV